MKYPKIIFQPMTLKDNIDLVKWAFFENSDSLDIYKYTIQYFPELASINKNTKSKKTIYTIIEKIVSANYYKNKAKILQKVQEYTKIWDLYNDNYFKALCEYLNVNFPDNIKVINAYIGLIPVFPRYLESFSFAISPDINKKSLIETCAHEVCHFLWFIKWKQLYPNCKKEEFESPFITWKYSEMVVDPILNSKEINDMLKITAKAYDYFYELKDDKTYVMQRLNDIYNSDDSIENIIQKGYEYINNYYKKSN